MDFSPIERAPEAFQQSVTAEQVEAMCRRAFGADVHPTAVTELGLGAYNSTYRWSWAAAGRSSCGSRPSPAGSVASNAS